MTNRYEDALEIARATEEDDFGNVFWACGVLAQEAEQLRKENERLVRENKVYAEIHKAWEACVYSVGIPLMRELLNTEYGDDVPPIPVVKKVTDLLDACIKLRKERDELALFIRLNHDVVKVPDHIFLMCVRAKKVAGE